MTEVPAGSFTPKATKFFTGLERDNSKEYWTANKGVFESEVKEPMAALVESLPEQFGPFRIFRMNRDIRFSADKSPYKTQHGAAHEVDGTVYYVHLDAHGLMAACGAYMMAPDQLERYREAVAAERTGRALQNILDDLSEHGFEVGHGVSEPLKTAPRGYPKDHPRVDLLRVAKRRISPGLRPRAIPPQHERNTQIEGPACQLPPCRRRARSSHSGPNDHDRQSKEMPVRRAVAGGTSTVTPGGGRSRGREVRRLHRTGRLLDRAAQPVQEGAVEPRPRRNHRRTLSRTDARDRRCGIGAGSTVSGWGEAFCFVEPGVDRSDHVLTRRDPGGEESTEQRVTVDRLRAAIARGRCGAAAAVAGRRSALARNGGVRALAGGVLGGASDTVRHLAVRTE